jgi:hypothetical protein
MMGGAAGAVVYAGYYYVQMIAILGWQFANEPDAFFEFVRLRMWLDGPNVALNWIAAGMELLGITWLAAWISVLCARQAYCESCCSWKSHLSLVTSPGTARAVEEALETGSFDHIVDPSLLPPRLRREAAWLYLEYCPKSDGDPCPSYLTLKESYKRANGKVKMDTLTKQRTVDAEILRNLSDKISAFRKASARLTGPTAVSSQPGERPLALATREEVSPGGRYPLETTWQNIVLISLSLVPVIVLLAGLLAIGLAFWDLKGQSDSIRLLVGFVGALSALGSGALLRYDGDYLAHRRLFRFTCNAITSRPDARVSPDTPQAMYVSIAPRQNWKIFGSCTDRGFLNFDVERRCLLFEGIQDRYCIPAASIGSCEIESMVPGNSMYAVVLRCHRSADGGIEEWEIPFRADSSGRAPNRARQRMARSLDLRERIEALKNG